MQDSQPEPPKKKSSPVLTILILIVVLGACVGGWLFIDSMIRPRGERIGETNLMDPLASILVEAKPGDSLFFRTDAAIGVDIITLVDDDQVDEQASRQLRTSQLTVRATSPSGIERASTCPLSNGRSATNTKTPGRYARSGMLNACVIPIDAAGRWTVRASVAWAPKVAVRSATLETRREAPR